MSSKMTKKSDPNAIFSGTLQGDMSNAIQALVHIEKRENRGLPISREKVATAINLLFECESDIEEYEYLNKKGIGKEEPLILELMADDKLRELAILIQQECLNRWANATIDAIPDEENL